MHLKSHIIPVLALLLVMLIYACKKEDAPVDEALPSCTLIAPADSSMVQSGEIVNIVAEVSGFSGDVKIIFSIDTLDLGETIAAPWDFQWDTEGWEAGPYRLTAHAIAPGELASDEITVIIIDTIPPLMAPVPVIRINPAQGTTDSIFNFDATASYDEEDPPGALMFRWDFDGDGSWDTEFTGEGTFLHKYTHQSNYQVRLEVMDSDSMTADTVRPLLVSPSSTPNACQGYVSVFHAGKVYKTVAIGEQCWLRENMDAGRMIHSDSLPSDNEEIEKYCYDNDTASCDKYGGLYTWRELMNYAPFTGSRGICPPGWHIPDDEDWKVLEGYVDSQYPAGDAEWENMLYRGFDAGRHLKSLLGWNNGGNGDNAYDFKALPGGSFRINYGFRGAGGEAWFWSSSHDAGQNAFHRMLNSNRDDIYRDLNWETAAFSVRCIRD